MTLFTKCILHEKSLDDGLRLSVMSRHTYSDGITLRLELDGFCDEHLPELGPSPKLIGKWVKGEISWQEYERVYKREIKESINATALIMEIIQKATKKNVTLMCIEEFPDKCHRRLLAEICGELKRNLVVKIR